MIQTILWDVDGTLLDFLAAEEAAIRKLFVEFDMGECSDEMLARYSKINRSYWERLERNEIAKQQVLVGRFEEFFASEGLDAGVAEQFNAKYQYALGDTIVPRDNCPEIVRKLQGKVRQYVVSNGTIIAQNKKLRLSGLGALMDGIFLSEELAVEKPNIEFFEKAFSSIGQVDPRETIIIGDSLSSDIRGGNNAGILTCWYNPSGKEAPENFRIDYEIGDLHQVFDLL